MEIIVLLVLLPLFFLPIIIAVKKNHPHRIPIILVNIFGGLFFGVGWLIALVWCFIVPSETQSTSNSSATELEKLYDLKEKGGISQEEYDSRKKTLLGDL